MTDAVTEIVALRSEVRFLRSEVELLRHESPRKLDSVAVSEILSHSSFDGTSLIEAEEGDPGRYVDQSTVMICPTRGTIDTRVVEAWMAMVHPMNQRRVGPIFGRGFEVATAYNRLVQHVVDHPILGQWRYLLTLEDDNIVPPDAHMRLLDAMKVARTEDGKSYDAISGLYFTKDASHRPMAFGSGRDFRRTGKYDCRVLGFDELDVPEGQVVEVLGIPQGCALWRTEMFEGVPKPWFATLDHEALVDGKVKSFSEITDDQTRRTMKCMTQDLFFCVRAHREAGKRFGLLPSLRVGHLDTTDGVVY